MTAPRELYGATVFRVAAAARGFFYAAGLAGALLVVTDHQSLAAVLLLTAFVGVLLAQLVIGIAGYRRAMRASWPKVAPLADDDWD